MRQRHANRYFAKHDAYQCILCERVTKDPHDPADVFCLAHDVFCRQEHEMLPPEPGRSVIACRNCRLLISYWTYSRSQGNCMETCPRCPGPGGKFYLICFSLGDLK